MSEAGEIARALAEENDSRYTALRDANRSLSAQLAKEKIRTAEMVTAAYQGARDGAAGLVIPVVERPERQSKKRRDREEWAVPMLSDTQIAKITPSYNTEVAYERVALYAEKVVHLTEVQRSDHPVRKCHVSLLGDMVEGEDIFPGQQWLIDRSLFRQVMVDGPEILMPFLLRMCETFEEVHVDCVDGNHGRVGRKGDHHPETNMDRFLYTFLQALFAKEPKYRSRIHFRTGADLHPSEPNWYMVGEIGNYRPLQIHGWEIQGNGPWHGLTLKSKVNSWAAGAIPVPFQDMFMGHFHQVGMIPLNQRKVYVNGSTESDNDFARHIIGAQSVPKQWLLFVDPEKARVSASYDVALDGE